MEDIEIQIDLKSEKIATESEFATQPHNWKEIESEFPTQPHNGKEIDRVIVSQYIDDDDPYVATYSKYDNSIHGWPLNAGLNEQKEFDAYFKFHQSYRI